MTTNLEATKNADSPAYRGSVDTPPRGRLDPARIWGKRIVFPRYFDGETASTEAGQRKTQMCKFWPPLSSFGKESSVEVLVRDDASGADGLRSQASLVLTIPVA
jgi:hypothetical protein